MFLRPARYPYKTPAKSFLNRKITKNKKGPAAWSANQNFSKMKSRPPPPRKYNLNKKPATKLTYLIFKTNNFPYY